MELSSFDKLILDKAISEFRCPKPRIYMAGKITKNGWRHEFLSPDLCRLGLTEGGCENRGPIPDWPVIDCGQFFYTGPYFIGCDHGCFHGDNSHGSLAQELDFGKHGGDPPIEIPRPDSVLASEIVHQCKRAIERSDGLFCWIDSMDCYGTIAEIGYAAALGKNIRIAISTDAKVDLDELWFIHELAHESVHYSTSPKRYLDLTLSWDRAYHFSQHLKRRCESPIEEQFYDRYLYHVARPYIHQLDLIDARSVGAIPTMVPQVQIGRYRADFYLLGRNTIIELDGHDYHKTRKQRTNDARRERSLEREGYRVIRFTGTEIYNDVDGCIAELAGYLKT